MIATQKSKGSKGSTLAYTQDGLDPEKFIQELFDFARLPELKELLWEWLKATVTGSYPKKLTYSEREAILVLYEKMEKLLVAVSLLQHTTIPKKSYRKKKEGA